MNIFTVTRGVICATSFDDAATWQTGLDETALWKPSLVVCEVLRG